MSQPHEENGAQSFLGASNPTLDADSHGDQGKLCCHRFLAVPITQVMRSERLRLLQTFPTPALLAVPMGESVLILSLTFLSTYMNFSSWTRACGKDFRGGGSLVFHQWSQTGSWEDFLLQTPFYGLWEGWRNGMVLWP